MTERHDAPLFERIGGEEGCWRLSRAFYARVAHDPVLRPFFGKSFRCAIEGLATFMTETLGGPARFSERRARPVIRGFHEHLRITPELTDSWIADMTAALDDLGIAGDERTALLHYFGRTASYLTGRPRAEEPQPAGATASPEAENLWQTYRATEALLELIAAGDAEAAISMLEAEPLAPRLAEGGPFLLAILGDLGTSGDVRMLDYARARLEREPDLVHGLCAYGATLLFHAAGNWCGPFVDFLIRLGADPNAGDRSALYGAANAVGIGNDSEAGGVQVAQALIAADADVNAIYGVKSCTSLHMAARRGHAGIAGALLDAGAAVNPRDSYGDTPLRRAVNCGHPHVAALLLSRGADPDSLGSRRLTPRVAARDARMRAVFVAHAGSGTESADAQAETR